MTEATLRTATCVLCLATMFYASARSDGYWQQEVNYIMEVTLADDLRTVNGSIEIEYINNSPDTLRVLYLKAFPNAIKNGSHADEKQRLQNDYSFASLKSAEEGSLALFDRSDEPSTHVAFEVDNTIITVYLATPLVSPDTLNLEFDFRTVLPDPGRMRMGKSRGVTKAAYWFPQACVYDHRLGWVNAQYLGWGECYGDFGTFDVKIAAPEDQIVAATGVLVNREEALPDSLRELLDISNFQRPEEEWPQLNLDSNKAKTWHYIAENVNDFAWTASKEFCIDSDSINGIEIVAYPLRHKANGWENAVELGKQSIETFSELYYPYQWPVIRICDAFSGMEYPMITNCSGEGPSPYFDLLLYHEIGHQWFMGQVGSNQVDRPFLDEGFTVMTELDAMEKYRGRQGNMNFPRNWYQSMMEPPLEDRNVRGFRPLLLLMKEDFDRPMIYTSYDQGREYWPYRVSAYYKSAAMHYSLRSIFGDSLYYEAMRQYCDRWFFKHPYEDDFTRSMEEAGKIEMDNFLDQWYYSRHRLDYGYRGKKSRGSGRTREHTIILERRGDFISPVDVAVVWEQGDTTFYTVPPEGMEYAKPGHILLPTWEQFRRPEPKYEFTVKAARDIREVVVDPFNLLMDIDRRNNQSGFFPPTEVRFDNMLYDRVPVNEYALRWRPDLWYDEPNGVQVGFHAHGSYLGTESRFYVDFRMGTESARPAVDITMATPFVPFGAHSKASQRYFLYDKRLYTSTVFEKKFRKWYSRPDNDLFHFQLDYFDLHSEQANRLNPLAEDIFKYLPDRTWDGTETWYARLTSGLIRTFRYGSYHFYNREAIGSYEEDDRHRAFVETQFLAGVDLANEHRTWLSLQVEYWSGTGEPPSQYLNHLSRARSIDRFTRSSVFRSPGTFPADWESDFYLPSGRVRGYQDRNLYLMDYLGGTFECTPPDLLPYRWLRFLPLTGGWLSSADQAFFVDGGLASLDGKESFYHEPIASSETNPEGNNYTFYMSAGVSIELPAFWRGHAVRVDFPVYLNRPTPEDNPYEFRFSIAWLLPDEF